jgi:hypothetical protein
MRFFPALDPSRLSRLRSGAGDLHAVKKASRNLTPILLEDAPLSPVDSSVW